MERAQYPPNRGGSDERSPMDPVNMANYKFTKEELRVLEECNKESFYKRSLPLSTLFATGAFAAVKRGILVPNARYGAVPKAVAGAVIGYIVGKLSYREECSQKLMQLPDSPIGKVLRQRRGVLYDTPESYSSSRSSSGTDSFSSLDSSSDNTNTAAQSPAFSLDIDIDRPLFSSSDESTYRPSLDSYNPTNPINDIPPYKPALSYDELRQQNREESMKNFKPYRSPENSPLVRNSPPEREVKNQYGDPVN